MFPAWALHINELTPELLAKLPPTDDRLRTDMRLFEHGYYVEVCPAPIIKDVRQALYTPCGWHIDGVYSWSKVAAISVAPLSRFP